MSSSLFGRILATIYNSMTPPSGRLHDARHTAARVLLLLGVPERAVMGVMGWSNTAMAARYQHVTATIQRDIATRVGGLIWRPGERN